MPKQNTTTAEATPTKPGRTLSPAILALREEHKGKVAALRAKEQSNKLLVRMVEDLKKLTDSDRDLMMEAVQLVAAPLLPLKVENKK